MNRIKRIVSMTIIALFVVTGLVSGETPVIANASPATVVSNASAQPNDVPGVPQSQTVTMTFENQAAMQASDSQANCLDPGWAPPSTTTTQDDGVECTVVEITNFRNGKEVGRSTKTVSKDSSGGVSPDQALSGWISAPPAYITNRRVDIYRERDSSIIGEILFRYHENIGWCWGWGVVGCISVISYADHVDSAYKILDVSVPPVFAGYYTLQGSSIPHSGYYERRQGHLQMDFWLYHADYWPWVKIFVHGDGSAYYTRGD